MRFEFTAAKIIWTLAAISLLVGGLLTLRSAAVFRRQADWIETKVADIVELRKLAPHFRATEAALLALEQMPTHELVRVETALDGVGNANEKQIQYGAVEDLPGDWKLQRASVVFERVRAAELLPAIGALEARRPPWRVVGCSLQSLPEGPGLLRSTLVLEGVER